MKDIFIERTEAPEKNAEVFQNFTFYSTDKYTHDLYYISPLYHLEFPAHLKRVIVTDLDLEFRIDLAELWGHFSRFSATEVIGIGPDLHPHYFINTQEYRESHPGTHVGSPGRFQVGTIAEEYYHIHQVLYCPPQGFNSGVVLYNLERMRQSAEYTAEVRLASMAALMDR